MTWYFVTGRWATFIFEVRDGRVVNCPPYARGWLMKMPWPQAKAYLLSKGFELRRL